jgi:hypothetical protein
VVFNSTFDVTPASYANNQWLQNVRVLQNGSAFGLVHNGEVGIHPRSPTHALAHANSRTQTHPRPPIHSPFARAEFKPELFDSNNPYCNCSVASNRSCVNHCEMWSTGLAVSHDGGDHFALVAPPPHHLVAALPVEFQVDQPLAGYGAISPLLPGSDGAYYGLINVAGNSAAAGVPTGNCLIRTPDLGDPTAYRGRDGDGLFTVMWRSPYDGPNEGWGQCATTATNSSAHIAVHACFREIVGTPTGDWPTFVALGDTSWVGHGPSGAVQYSWSHEPEWERAISNWTKPQYIELTGASRWMGDRIDVLYPVLLDASSPDLGQSINTARAIEQGDNFAFVGVESPDLYVYIVTSFRNIIRHRVKVSATPPTPPSPPSPPAPMGCTAFRVVGAGNAGFNGVYNLSNVDSTGSPQFQKDDTHQLYRLVEPGGLAVWHLGHWNVGGSVLYTTPITGTWVNASLPPPEDWRCAQPSNQSLIVQPAPLSVLCCE